MTMEMPKLGNIPLYNLLDEFIIFEGLLISEDFKAQFKKGKPMPINTPLLIWLGMQNDLLTLILQRTILGLESYVIGAVWTELGMAGKLTKENNKLVRNPFLIKRGAGTADSYYNQLPSLLPEAVSLKSSDEELWDEVSHFYKHVRNPLFHGQQLETDNPNDLIPMVEMVRNIYSWIDSWHQLEVKELKRRYIILKPGKS
ncbi:MAG: hypothetical protein ABW168_14195 [Sedimenticola sp.]